MADLSLVTLNLAYDPRIPTDSPEHFDSRWPRIVERLRSTDADVIALQECHSDWLPLLSQFAEAHGYDVKSVRYHDIRSTHLVTMVRPELVAWHTTRYTASYTSTLTLVIMVGDRRVHVTNVHLPLDAACAGERVAVTTQVATEQIGRTSVVLGDWNTLPELGGDEQLTEFTRLGFSMVDWTFVEDDGRPSRYPRSTAWGFAHEPPRFREFTSPAVLDRAALSPTLEIVSAECVHDFRDGIPISDHFLCTLGVRLS